MNEHLTQEEINALMARSLENQEAKLDISEYLSPDEIDTLGEIGNIAMGGAATNLSVLLNRKVTITTPKVSATSLETLRQGFVRPFVAVKINYIEGLAGLNILVLKDSVTATIASLMMGQDASEFEPEPIIGELELSAVGEAMNQMMGAAATSLSSMFKRRITISAPTTALVSQAEETTNLLPQGKKDDLLVQVAFQITFGENLQSEIMQLIPLHFAKEMVASLLHAPDSQPGTPVAAATSAPQGNARPASELEATKPVPEVREREKGTEKVVVRPAQFTPLTPNKPAQELPNLELIMDVPLKLTVELGRARMTIKEVLEMGVGSVIELDKLAGEPVDLLVNGKLVARGEVVVIDECFGVKVTEIASRIERLTASQSGF